MSCLVVTSGHTKGRTFQIDPQHDTLIGRIAECDVCIVDPRMSRRHCVVSSGQAGYVIRDLGSANGIMLNGTKVSEAALKDADRVCLGTTELEFHLTERFEDGVTKRVAPGEQAAPDLAAPAPARPKNKNMDTKPIEFCARCEGSVAPSDVNAGRAIRSGGELLCAECMAGEQASRDAQGMLKGAGAGAEPAGRADASEVSRLAAELSEAKPVIDSPEDAARITAPLSTAAARTASGRLAKSEPPPGDEASEPSELEDSGLLPIPETIEPVEVKVNEAKEPNTEALMFLDDDDKPSEKPEAPEVPKEKEPEKDEASDKQEAPAGKSQVKEKTKLLDENAVTPRPGQLEEVR